MSATKNARFWIVGPNNGAVKLTLRPGQSLSYSTGGPTDEGFEYYGETYRHEGDHVVRMTAYEASDCDGRYDSYRDASCPLDSLDSKLCQVSRRRGSAYPVSILDHYRMPEWQEDEFIQRDHSAEAAGY